MTTRVVIEKKNSRHLPSVEVHLNALLSEEHGGTGCYSNPFYEGAGYRWEGSAIGRQIMDGIQFVPGIGDIMCSSYSFTFDMAMAFDSASIIADVIEVIETVLQDELDINLQEGEYNEPFAVEASEVADMLEMLMA